MPFNPQMSFPVDLSLRTFPEGIRLCREPVAEIHRLNDRPHTWRQQELAPDRDLLPPTDHDPFHIQMEVEPSRATSFGVIVHGIDLRYHVAERKLHLPGQGYPGGTARGTATGPGPGGPDVAGTVREPGQGLRVVLLPA